MSNLFDFSDFYLRMASEIPDNATIVEVGVCEGDSAIFLAKSLNDLGKKYRLVLVDNLAYGGWQQLGLITNNIRELLGLEIMAIDSLNASCNFPNGTLDFVFIDASHEYEKTKADILLWYRKVKIGGVLAGHDYATHKKVHQAVDEIIPSAMTESTTQGWGVWFIKRTEMQLTDSI